METEGISPAISLLMPPLQLSEQNYSKLLRSSGEVPVSPIADSFDVTKLN